MASRKTLKAFEEILQDIAVTFTDKEDGLVFTAVQKGYIMQAYRNKGNVMVYVDRFWQGIHQTNLMFGISEGEVEVIGDGMAYIQIVKDMLSAYLMLIGEDKL